ncbi:MAG: lipid-A-disaccharide synthase [Vicinamibacteria bacterium]|nr:lipid-A-disaccharide synthase [Vicinamibacteria bacterium]
MDSLSLLVSCGETSGDLYAAEVVRRLRTRQPDLRVFGLGGDRLAGEGVRLAAHVRDMAVIGLFEIISSLRRLHGIYRRLLDEIDRERPQAAVLVDYSGFNLRLARALRARNVPIVYYVSPQVWAWRRGRVRTIRETVARMAVIFPFEEPFYRAAGVPVTFVGHPLVDLLRAHDTDGFLKKQGLDPDRPVIAVLPGSRTGETSRHLPLLARAVARLEKTRPELQFLVAAAPHLDATILARRLDGTSARLVQGRSHDVLAAASVAVVASGTATVEAALLGAPMVVVYRVSPLSYVLGRHFVHVPHYAMANLIAGRRIVPELIQRDFTPERVCAETLLLLDDAEKVRRMREDLAEVRRRLGGPGASDRAADVVQEVLASGQNARVTTS